MILEASVEGLMLLIGLGYLIGILSVKAANVKEAVSEQLLVICVFIHRLYITFTGFSSAHIGIKHLYAANILVWGISFFIASYFCYTFLFGHY